MQSFIAYVTLFSTGSENNSVYVYSKQISTPMLTYKFSIPSNSLVQVNKLKSVCSLLFVMHAQTDLSTNQETTDSTEFVSSVCWKKVRDRAKNRPCLHHLSMIFQEQDIILAANSQGYIKLLEMV